MEDQFVKKVISEVNGWTGNYEAKEINGLVVVYFDGEEVAFIKNYKADCEAGGDEQAVEVLQYYCDNL